MTRRSRLGQVLGDRIEHVGLDREHHQVGLLGQGAVRVDGFPADLLGELPCSVVVGVGEEHRLGGARLIAGGRQAAGDPRRHVA